MEFNYRPSLQQMCAIRLASELLKDADIAKLAADELRTPRSYPCAYRVRHQYWEMVETKAMEKMTKLPRKLQNSVAKLIRPLYYQALRWSSGHTYIRTDFQYLVCNNLLCWKTDGTIDNMKSAAAIARYEAIDLKCRFVIACTYFLEDEIFAIWCQLHETEYGKIMRRKKIFPRGSNKAVRFWVNFFEKGADKLWRQMVPEYFRIATFQQQDSPIAMSGFFRYLPSDLRRVYIGHFGSLKIQNCDFRLCLFEMDERELKHLFDSNYFVLLTLFLEWPFQSLFIDMVQKLMCRMTTRVICMILEHILKIKILENLEDLEYLLIVEEFWNLIPSKLKESITTNKRFLNLIQKVLCCNKENQLALGEMIERYYYGKRFITCSSKDASSKRFKQFGSHY